MLGRIALAAALLLLAPEALAYEVWLDLDDDDDPNTLVLVTDATTATARLVLAPSAPGEEIGFVTFGLGGTCRECDWVHQYGVTHDLLAESWDEWDERDDFHSTAMGATLLGCPDDPGFHLVLELQPVEPPFVLTEPIFLATFEVSVDEPLPGCPRVPANLATMFAQGEGGFWNYIQLGGPAIPVEAPNWGGWKGRFR